MKVFSGWSMLCAYVYKAACVRVYYERRYACVSVYGRSFDRGWGFDT